MMNQARMTQKQFLRIVGDRGARDLNAAIGSIIEVSPEQVKGNFDLIPFDGSLPIDTISQAQALLQFVQLAVQNGMQLDMPKVMDDYSNLIGVGSAQKYIAQEAPQIGAIVPDDQIQAQVQQGNLVPPGQGLGTLESNG